MRAAHLTAWLVLAVLLVGLGISTMAVSAGVVREAPLQTATPTLVPGTGAVVGIAWDDTDSDGVRDPDELPLEGMLITAQSAQGTATASSGVDGGYRLIGLLPGQYTLSATPPPGYQMTTPAALNIWVTAGIALTFDFGAVFVPTPTPTPTEQPVLDVQNAERAYCGGIYPGDTSLTGRANVSRYGCRPAWDESGPEVVFRIELDARQPVSATLVSAAVDLDLFLLRYAYPDSCVAAADNSLSYIAEPGVYYLAVDGYRGAAGAFTLRLDCPLGAQASPTPTFTPSATPTATLTHTPAPTPTPSATVLSRRLYLPLVLRMITMSDPVTLVLQHGVDGYSGSADTTLNSWYLDDAFGARPTLKLSYAHPPDASTQMAPLLRFDVSQLPPTAHIADARLSLYLVSSSDSERDLRGQVHGLLRAWDENSATWNQPADGESWAEPGAQAEGQDHSAWASAAQRVSEVESWYEFDVTELVSAWAGDPSGNYGLIIMALAGDSEANVTMDFASREGTTLALRPQLAITYSYPLVNH